MPNERGGFFSRMTMLEWNSLWCAERARRLGVNPFLPRPDLADQLARPILNNFGGTLPVDKTVQPPTAGVARFPDVEKAVAQATADALQLKE
jgi:hypothetical protein